LGISAAESLTGPGPPRRSPRPPRAGLRLVHRRLRHRRSERSKGILRQTGVSRQLARAGIRHECPLPGRPDYPQARATNGS